MKKEMKIVREGTLVAEVEVDLIDSDEPWAPFLSVEDARKLDSVRRALREGDTAAAAKIAKVYRLTPISSA